MSLLRVYLYLARKKEKQLLCTGFQGRTRWNWARTVPEPAAGDGCAALRLIFKILFFYRNLPQFTVIYRK